MRIFLSIMLLAFGLGSLGLCAAMLLSHAGLHYPGLYMGFSWSAIIGCIGGIFGMIARDTR